MGVGTCMCVGNSNMVYTAAVMVHHPASGDEEEAVTVVDTFPHSSTLKTEQRLHGM